MKLSALTAIVLTLAAAPARAETSVLQSLPAEVQKDIEDVRAACRENLDARGADASQSWISPTAHAVASVSSGDDGLILFTVSGAQAVMVNDLELCGGQCLRGGGGNCSNWGGYTVAIYVRARKSLEEGPFD